MKTNLNPNISVYVTPKQYALMKVAKRKPGVNWSAICRAAIDAELKRLKLME